MSCQTGLVLALLWLMLLYLAPAKGESEIPPRAFLLLHPSWSTTFQGESVKLTCMAVPSSEKGPITWCHNNNVWKTKSEEIQIKDSGYYQCKTQRSHFSEPVHVEFSSDEVILQVSPHPIFEGDDVFLKCQRKSGQLNKATYYKDEKILQSNYSDTIKLFSVSRDSSKYSCTAFWKTMFSILWHKTSKPLKLQIQELFLPPVLMLSPRQPNEGDPVTLTCETRLPPQKSHVQLRFCFFKDGIPVSDVNLETRPPGGQLIEGENLVLICSVAKGTGTITFSWHKDGTSVSKKTQQSLLAELLIPTVKMQDAGRYYCVADNGGPILSNRKEVTVRGLVSRPVLILRTPRHQAVVGDVVQLHCEASKGSPPIWYQFYHEDITLGNSSAPNGGGASFNFSLTEEGSGNYTCDANNGLGPQRSDRVSLKVIVPVSDIVLSLRAPETQAMVGDEVEIYCEALKGSPPILYQFYHEDMALGNSLAPMGGGASFKFIVTTEHAGNYSCEADNGLEPQRSEVMTFNITGPCRSRAGLISAGVTGGLLGVLGLPVAAILLRHFRTQRKLGLSAPGASSPSDWQEPSFSRISSTPPQEHLYDGHPAFIELQPIYNNVNPEGLNMVYSQIQSSQPRNGNSANSPRMCQKDKEPVVIYSELRTACCDDSSQQASNHQEGDTEDYENVPRESAVLDH
ncbi:PREDICTED: Fc receptor-like protein 3 isoform X4 [Dipodomys ordii]|uniref:Fc receptor-like protein 3 isoform X4 n=1 Tax=Dipodomys ordii TaxID=10020 RepID=A0A1S3GB53_DIPOR|nr:PREDICTED: Fc receptor-like protein 3 isoform X4 [Dipodomys ordii]